MPEVTKIMQINCPVCNKEINIHVFGRKSYPIDVTNVFNACRNSRRQDGRVSYQGAAELLSEEVGYKVSRAFVYMRISKEAELRGRDRHLFLNDVLSGKIRK